MACGCEIVECVRVVVNPCSPGTELPIASTVTGNVAISIDFNGATSLFQISATEGDNLMVPTFILNEKYTHRMEVLGQCYELRTSPAVTPAGTTPPSPPISGNTWEWGSLIINGNSLTSPLLAGELAPIVYVSEMPVSWVAQGWVHNPNAGTLTTPTTFVNADIIFQYRNI